MRNTIEYDYAHCDIHLPDQMDSDLWMEYCDQNQPLLSTLLRINQRNLETLVELQSRWISDDLDWYWQNAHWYPKWVYSSLICLRLPLEGHVISSLRQIARMAIKLRKELKQDQLKQATPLNLIISIVTRNFNQSDLDRK